MKDFFINERIIKYSKLSVDEFLKETKIPSSGLNKKQIEKIKEVFKTSKTSENKKDSVLFRLKRAFINPFSIVLFILAVISFITEIIFPKNLQSNYITVITILIMLITSGLGRFIQEMQSKKITDKLIKIADSKIKVFRNNEWIEINKENLVIGDKVFLQQGDKVPCDIRLTMADTCFVSQSVITGESRLQEKITDKVLSKPKKINDFLNMIFAGSTIVSGKCEGIVLATGKETVYGEVEIKNRERNKGFDKGANSIVWVLIKFMILMVPIVFVASGLTNGNWLNAFVFALSAAIGLTPELLPMVITACLGKGSYNMKEKQTIVKNMNAMQEFGSMDVLCVDKTGTLTGDKLVLEYYMDILGNEYNDVLDLAYLNSYFHSGIKNHIDNSILKINEIPGKSEYYNSLKNKFIKLDELPFDYKRKISTVLLKEENKNKNLIITKGTVEEIVKRSSYVEYKNKKIKITDDKIQSVRNVLDDMLEDGMKVLAIGVKEIDDSEIQNNKINSEMEKDLILAGYIVFFDAPKKTAINAINKLKKLNVNIKVLTGDDSDVALSICKRLGIDTSKIITGEEFDLLTDDEVQIYIENCSVFAELSPKQKAKIISLLKSNGHKVGFLGDGMNDLPALIESDVGISVENASENVKEIADVILLKKDLAVLEEGIMEGRKAFTNMSKYIKITASSNFGNIFAIVIASVVLPFFPMTSIQILLLNLLYDILCLALPWDKVDEELCFKPLEWSGKNLSGFMLFFGPVSSLFDIITFVFLFYFFCPGICGGSFLSLSLTEQNYFISLFQTGWFLESIWTQILILQLLRTGKIPILQSKPSGIVLSITIIGIFIFSLLVMTPIGNFIGFTKLPSVYFVFLILIVVFYLFFMSIAKKIYIKKHGSLI